MWQYKNVIFLFLLFPTVDLLQNTQRYYEIYYILLLTSSVAPPVKQCASIVVEVLYVT
jgi:hypothetical protein